MNSTIKDIAASAVFMALYLPVIVAYIAGYDYVKTVAINTMALIVKNLVDPVVNEFKAITAELKYNPPEYAEDY